MLTLDKLLSLTSFEIIILRISPEFLCYFWDLFRYFKVYSDAKEREWGAESNGKLPHLFIPGKTAALVHEFVVEDLPSAELQPSLLRLQ